MMAAAAAGGRVHQYVHPTARGPGGGTLSCDVCVLGPSSARKAFVAIAGTHGVEGFAGSAAHLILLNAGTARDIAPDCRIVLVHAINPYGFAHGSRTTENNVDLNRNFIDHNRAHPENARYAELHPIVCQTGYSPKAHQAQIDALREWTERFGVEARNEALIAGQYTAPSGRSYGGRDREWSNRVLERIVLEHLRGVERIAFIDWHTGLGRYGEELLLCFNPEGSAQREQCIKWWGAQRIGAMHGFEGARRPRYQGLLFHGLEAFTAPAQLAGAVVEFGILSNEDQEAVFMLDHWLRFGDHNGVTDETLAKIRARVLESFTPAAPAWRLSVATRMAAIQEQALSGLRDW